jgi:hypothetical protein
MKITRKPAALAAMTAAACLALAAGSLGVANAVTATSPVHHAALFGCVSHNGSGTFGPETGYPVTCPAGSILAEVGPGTTGPAGPAGAQGPAGPSGVTAVTTETGTAVLPAIGGSWTAGHAAVKSFTVPAGTYLVTVTGDFYKAVTTTATPVLQVQLNGASSQLTGYTGAFPYNAAEAVGATAGVPNGLEQTAVAEGIVTVTAGATLEVDSFGYNPDRSGTGGGDFGVNATVSLVRVTAAS